VSLVHGWFPCSIECLRGYTVRPFLPGLIAGLTVGLVVLPLAMAFAIASGVPPQAGLYTAVVAGFLISALGGSRTPDWRTYRRLRRYRLWNRRQVRPGRLGAGRNHGRFSAAHHGLHGPWRSRQVRPAPGYDRLYQRHRTADCLHPDQRFLWHEDAAGALRVPGPGQDAHSLCRNDTMANRSCCSGLAGYHFGLAAIHEAAPRYDRRALPVNSSGGSLPPADRDNRQQVRWYPAGLSALRLTQFSGGAHSAFASVSFHGCTACRSRKLRWIDGRNGGVGAVGVLILEGSDVAGEGRLWIASVLDAEDGIGKGWEVAEVEAADRSVELIEAEGFAALERGKADQLPAVGEFAEECGVLGELGKLGEILQLENVGAVEVGRGVGVAEVVRIVSGEEEAYVTLLVEGVAVGVGDSELRVVRESLDDVGLEGVVGRDTRRFEQRGVGTVTDVRDAEVDVASVERVVRLGGDGVEEFSVGRVGVENLPAVAGGFAVNGAAGSCDSRLIKGHGDNGVAAKVAGVADGDGEVVAWLPLDVEFEVKGVGELVAHVVGAEVEGRGRGATAIRLVDDAGTSGFHCIERGKLSGEEGGIR